MRWKWKKPEDWDTRIKTWFALWPVIIKNECRWLETVTVKQRYLVGWYNVEFVDEETKHKIKGKV